MDLREALLKEHSKKQTLKISAYIGTDKKLFAALIKLFLANEHPVTARSAWVLSHCATSHPQLILPYLKVMIDNLYTLNLHDAVKRNTYRILQSVTVPEALTGKLATCCFDVLNNKKEAVAIKVFAMTVLLHIVKSNPELKRELQLIIQEQMPYSSAGFKSRGQKVLNELNKIKI
jgi:hypothetical protein